MLKVGEVVNVCNLVVDMLKTFRFRRKALVDPSGGSKGGALHFTGFSQNVKNMEGQHPIGGLVTFSMGSPESKHYGFFCEKRACQIV